MNQTNQRSIIHYISAIYLSAWTAALTPTASVAGSSDPSVGQWCCNVVICNLLPSHLCMLALHVAISPVACWFGLVSFFLPVTFIILYTVPDAWRRWAGPRLAYCRG